MEMFGAMPPSLRRRAIGGVYLLYFLVAFLGAGLKSHAVVVVSDAVYVVLTLLFFLLLRHVNAGVAILATAFSLAGQALDVIFDQAAAGLVADGLFLLLLGSLWWRSRLIPRALAGVVTVAGVGWLTFAIPGLPTYVQIPVEVVGAVAELALMLWLLIRGVDVTPNRPTIAEAVPV